jgi:hypothetical protein
MANTHPINPWIEKSGNVDANAETTLELDKLFQGLKWLSMYYLTQRLQVIKKMIA